MRSAVLLALIASCARTTPVAMPQPGPRALEAIPNVHGAEELRQALASGPEHLWLAPGIYGGPFAVKRPVAISGTHDVVFDQRPVDAAEQFPADGHRLHAQRVGRR